MNTEKNFEQIEKFIRYCKENASYGIDQNFERFQKLKKAPPEKERIEVGKMSCGEMANFLANKKSKWVLSFQTNKHIHYEKAHELCSLLERYLNGEMDNPAPKVTSYSFDHKSKILSATIEVEEPKPIEKDFEILMCRNDYHDGSLHPYKKGTCQGEDRYSPCNNAVACIKHTVKRISDNAIFTVGEKTDKGVINFFEWEFDSIKKECTGRMIVQFKNGKEFSRYYLSELKKPKQILFTTEDGVDIYYCAKRIWQVHPNWCSSSIPINTLIDHNLLLEDGKYFSNEQAAQDYIVEQAPMLSVADLRELHRDHILVYDIRGMIRFATELVKQRITTETQTP